VTAAASARRSWPPLLAGVASGGVAGVLGALMSRDWAQTAAAEPMNIGSQLSVMGAYGVAALLLIIGVVLLAAKRVPAGAILLMLGVGFGAGVAIGSSMGADGSRAAGAGVISSPSDAPIELGSGHVTLALEGPVGETVEGTMDCLPGGGDAPPFLSTGDLGPLGGDVVSIQIQGRDGAPPLVRLGIKLAGTTGITGRYYGSVELMQLLDTDPSLRHGSIRFPEATLEGRPLGGSGGPHSLAFTVTWHCAP
jgi:hypothetical protein